jgi:predicted DCC family thiol-disulfide oxidoreductase YuxK
MIDPVPENGVLLYDDSCGICRHWVLRWSRTLRRNGFEVAPLQSDWVPEKLNIRAGALTEDVRLLLPDGRQIQGADVYRYAMKRIWWAYPVYLLSVTPLLHFLFNGAYRAFADHRHRVSRLCGIAPPR